MLVSAIFAKDLNGVIGNGNKLPWPHNKADMSFFQQHTLGKPVIVGRKTYETLPFPLYGRVVIVVSRSYTDEEVTEEFRNNERTKVCVVEKVNSIEKAFKVAKSYYKWAEVLRRKIDVALEKNPDPIHEIFNEVVIIGGAEIYKQTIDRVNMVYESVINGEFDGDVNIPDEVTKFINEKMVSVFYRQVEQTGVNEKIPHEVTFTIYRLCFEGLLEK